MRKLTTAEFVARAKRVHGAGAFDYTSAIYISSKHNVIVCCHLHGLFEQNPSQHLAGKGCRLCADMVVSVMRRGDASSFTVRARAVHGEKYDYSKSVYVRSAQKLTIICPDHGEFEQTPSKHLHNSQGCPKCGDKRGGEARLYSGQDFLEKARAVHGEKYDYSKSVYVRSAQKLTIICPDHGEFEQTPNDHLHGYGCSQCAKVTTGNKLRRTFTNFLTAARAVHGEKYDYSKSVYVRADVKLAIICPQHGEFKQGPARHTQGGGCALCANDASAARRRLHWIEQSKGRPGVLYFLRLFYGGESFYKVGVTYHSVERRYSDKAKLNGYSYEVIALHKSANAAAVYDWEQSIIQTFAHLRYSPKRAFGGETECFSRCEEILEVFPL